MRRLQSLISALMLVLVLWTAPAARAAEAIDCSEVAASTTIGHFEGDGDEVPADSDGATPHHHNACSGHCLAVPAGAQCAEHHDDAGKLLIAASSDLSGGSGPDTSLRPPIA
jgi:hypothetical protein